MGLLEDISAWQRLKRTLTRRSQAARARGPRICRFEQIEHRWLLSASPIQIGCVYFEDGIGTDTSGDLFEVTWSGGAEGTQLTRLVIDTDKLGDGISPIDCFFDTAPGGLGVSGSAGVEIVANDGFDILAIEVEDGGTTLAFTFSGFDAGKRLLFSVDVDEKGLYTDNPLAEGAEFEGSHLVATFAASHYYDVTESDIFWDEYDGRLTSSGLKLPPDSYVPPGQKPRPDLTAGAFIGLKQTPLPISISGTVFEDIDLDNRQDAGEPGIAGVKLSLYQLVEGQYADTGMRTTTGTAGNYRFDGLLPGTYRVVETQPDGYFSVGAAAGAVDGAARGSVLNSETITGISLLGGEDSVNNDFAEAAPARLSGHVYHDANNDGVRGAGEVGIAGATVRVIRVLPNGTTAEPITVTTAADGSWMAVNLMPGDWQVVEITPQGYLDGLDAAGTAGGTAQNPGDSITGIRLESGQAGEDYDFGEILPSSIAGRVIADADGDGAFTAGDFPIEGVTIELRDGQGKRIGTATTDADGRYRFTGLAPGVYAVEEIQPQGYFDGADHVGTAGGTLLAPDAILDITLVSGTQATGYDFYEILPSSISGRVSVDLDGNGLYDAGEPLLGGVAVHLLSASGERIASTLTDAKGEYEFAGLAPGVYGVEEIQPQGYFDGPDHVGSAGGALVETDKITGITLVSGTHGVRYDFYELLPVSLSGYVYEDLNDNGQRDAGEAGIAGVTLTLLDAAGQPTGTTAATDGGGFYRFDGLKPNMTYGVSEAQPAGYYDGRDAAGSAGGAAQNPGDMITGALLSVGVHGENYNFGELPPASISGLVHGELNGDCIPDPGEPLLGGVTIHLVDASGNRIASTTTDSAGRYVFTNLRPGVYGVDEVQPEGYLQGKTHAGSEGGRVEGDRILDIDLMPGIDGVDYNFCEVVPASISGYVFQDGPVIEIAQGEEIGDPINYGDGQLKPDDQRIAGVVLQLGDGSGAPLLDLSGNPITAVTDQNGYYEFTNLYPGLYTVLEVHPEDYTDGIDTPGTAGGIAVNTHEEIDPMVLSQLAVDPQNDAIIRIPLGMGEQARDYNFSELLVRETTPIMPPPPERGPSDPLPPPTAWIGSPPPAAAVLYSPSPIQEVRVPHWAGGGGFTPTYSWHLSIINGGKPRQNDDDQTEAELLAAQAVFFDPLTWTGSDVDEGEWTFADLEGNVLRRTIFGIEDGIPVVGDFNGDGVDEIAVFRDGIWLFDLNGNGRWDEGDLWAKLGNKGDLPVAGDWDGDGKTDIGVFGPSWIGDEVAIEHEPGLPDVANQLDRPMKNVPPEQRFAASDVRLMKQTSRGNIRSDLIDHVFQYGSPGDRPVAGDWNGDGVVNIGLFRAGVWYLDRDGDGRWSAGDLYVEDFGAAGDVPVVGDWNGDGIDNLGIYRDGRWYLDTNGNYQLDAHDRVLQLGGPDDKPVAGDFDGDGVDEIAIYRSRSAPEETRSE
ncbi:MAG: SdrD B-like domain-containing protein [Thermoguttaceae bacterium]